MTKDPVCGMRGKEEFKYEYKGKAFYFCSSLCKDEFKNFPDKYVTRDTRPPHLKRIQGEKLPIFQWRLESTLISPLIAVD